MKNERLLVADDDTHICELLKEVAESVGYTVYVTNNFEDFKAAYQSFKPSMITLDLNLTDNDGVELIKYLSDQQSGASIPENVCFEVTETAMYTEPAIAMNILTRLGIKGFKISIDDFAVGFSSLIQLQKMPFTEIKIDKSFILNSLEDPGALITAKSIADLGRNLRLLVVAEGVENKEILDNLKSINCDVFQGCYISRPISGHDFNQWMKNN